MYISYKNITLLIPAVQKLPLPQRYAIVQFEKQIALNKLHFIRFSAKTNYYSAKFWSKRDEQCKTAPGCTYQ